MVKDGVLELNIRMSKEHFEEFSEIVGDGYVVKTIQKSKDVWVIKLLHKTGEYPNFSSPPSNPPTRIYLIQLEN